MPGIIPRTRYVLVHLNPTASRCGADEETVVRNPFCLASTEAG